tara:strand:+ start:1209 stop:2285 length:1077 start_codon:yes stop_codon:yes gene_type:complete
MQSETQNNYLKELGSISQHTFQGNSARKLPKRNKKNESAEQKNRLFSNLAVQPILAEPIFDEFTEHEFRELSRLMVNATRNLTGSIDTWKFSKEDSLQDLILRCGNRLRDRAQVDHIDVLHNDGEHLKLGLKRFIGSREKVYIIYLKPILAMKNKNRLLYNVLLSFVKSLPFDSIFDTDEDENTNGSIIDWIWSCLLGELESCKAYDSDEEYAERLEGSVNFSIRHKTVYRKFKAKDWKSQLAEYCPKKKIYKEIKELLLTAEKVDFNTPFRVTVSDDSECDMEHYQTFLIADYDESDFISTYIDMLNANANEYDMLSAYTYAIVEDGNVEKFEENITQELIKVEDFICNLNNLLDKI